MLHDLDLIHEGTFVNFLFVFIPPLLWIAVAVLLRIRRPFLTLLAVGAVYGVFVALVHQLLWHQAFPEGSPSLGGNLADVDPVLQEAIMRGFTVVPSVVTGLLVGAVCGLVAAGLEALVARIPRASSDPFEQ